MKRTSTVGGGESGHEGNNHNNNKRNNKKHRPHPPPVLGTVATRTRHQQKTNASTWQQPLPVLINIMGYANPETIRMLCCVSKQFYDLITNDPGMENNRVIPLLQISASEQEGNDFGRIERLLNKLDQNQNRLQLIREVKVINGEKFDYNNFNELARLMETFRQRFTGVVALDLSSPTKMVYTNYYILTALRTLLPNLREINLSNTGIQSHQLKAFAEECSRLEKITYNHSSGDSHLSMDGKHMNPAKNLKEIYMDDSSLFAPIYSVSTIAVFSDLENNKYSNIFLFHKCSKGLERVSIKNLTRRTGYGLEQKSTVPQNVLIKFVRNTPTLKWLRSDLTQDNIEMLQSEQQQRFSKIEFVQ